MNISKTSGVGVRPDINYKLKNLTSNKSSLKLPISNDHTNDDTISISNEGKVILADEKNSILNNERSNALAEMLRQLEESPSKSDDSFSDKIKCILIATRIINGDNVPSKDRKFLAEKEPQMYSNALLLRKKNDKPKKYKSLLEDEEDDNPFTKLKGPNTPAEPVSEGTVSTENIEVSIDLEA